jgi:hypothetical protein
MSDEYKKGGCAAVVSAFTDAKVQEKYATFADCFLSFKNRLR